MVNNNGDDGKSVADEAKKDGVQPFEQSAEPQETHQKDAFIGVDAEGYFVCKVHTTCHPWMIIGGLTDAIAQYRGMLIRKQKEMEDQRKKLMGRSRGFFNLLKP